jgi:4'-phosphopantetheinyl transferase EntD
MTAEDPLKEHIVALFDAPVVVVHGVPAIVTRDLFPEERNHVFRAVPKRQAEFGTARVFARRALVHLGYAPQSLHPLPDRAPRWPEGIVGSITHCADLCAVAVARTGDAHGIGLDAEPDVPLEAALERYICTPGELALLDEQSPAERGRLAKILFCAKEAFYKCQYPTTQAFLDFLDVEIDFQSDLQSDPPRFTVRIVGRAVPHARRVEGARGRFDIADGRIFAGVTL